MSWVTDAGNFLDGRKTDLVCLAAFVIKILGAVGVIDQTSADEIVTWMVPAGIMALRSAVRKTEV